MASSAVVKQITFPSGLIERVEKRISRLGIGMPEYIRHLVINDVMPMIELSKEEENSFLRGIEDYKAGRTTLVKTKKELHDYLDSLKETPNGKSPPG